MYYISTCLPPDSELITLALVLNGLWFNICTIYVYECAPV